MPSDSQNTTIKTEHLPVGGAFSGTVVVPRHCRRYSFIRASVSASFSRRGLSSICKRAIMEQRERGNEAFDCFYDHTLFFLVRLFLHHCFTVHLLVRCSALSSWRSCGKTRHFTQVQRGCFCLEQKKKKNKLVMMHSHVLLPYQKKRKKKENSFRSPVGAGEGPGCTNCHWENSLFVCRCPQTGPFPHLCLFVDFVFKLKSHFSSFSTLANH